jgi:hypothetical protein
VVVASWASMVRRESDGVQFCQKVRIVISFYTIYKGMLQKLKEGK